MEISYFQRLLVDFMSSENDIRNSAELQIMNFVHTNPDNAISAFMTVLSESEELILRSLSSVLLRRILTSSIDELWSKIAQETKIMLKNGLINLSFNETDHSVRAKVCDTISEVGAIVMSEEDWPQLSNALFENVRSESPEKRESALMIFSMLSHFLIESLEDYLDSVFQIFSECLSENQPPQVQSIAIRATGYFLIAIGTPSTRKTFQDIIPLIIQALLSLLQNGKDQEAQTSIEVLIDIVEEDSPFFREYLGIVLEAMFSIASNIDFVDNVRQLAIEFLVSLAEKSPSMIRKIPENAFVEAIVPILLSMMLEVESTLDDEEWAATQSDEDRYSNYSVARDSFDRLAGTIGASKFLSVAFVRFGEFFAENSWIHKYCALIALSQVLEPLPLDHIGTVVEKAVIYTQDPHPRVRFAALTTLGQLFTDQGPTAQTRFHAETLPPIVQCLQDPVPRVRSQAAAVLVNFSDMATRESVEPHLELALSYLFNVLQDDSKMVKEQGIVAIESIADRVGDAFHDYYDVFVPALKEIFTSACGSDDKMLRGKALECLTFIGSAVGQEKFETDAEQIMQVSINAVSEGFESDDLLRSFFVQAWIRVCGCLKKHFASYLPHIISIVLDTANIQPEVKERTRDEFDEGDPDDESDEIASIQIGNKLISIKTSTMEEKASGCQLLSCFAADLEECYFPYVIDTAKILLPLASFIYDEDVKTYAISALPALLESYAKALEQGICTEVLPFQELFNETLNSLIKAVRGEQSLLLIQMILQALSRSIQAGSLPIDPEKKAMLNEEISQELCTVLLRVLRESIQRRAVREAKHQVEEDYDEEQEETDELENVKEEQLQSEITRAITACLKTHSDAFLPVLEATILPTAREMIHPDCMSSDRRLAVFIFDDVIEFCSPTEYYGELVQALLDNLHDEDASLKQACAYGIGMASNVENFKPFVIPAVESLCHLINQPDSRDKNNESVTDNAVSALGLVLQHHSDSFESTPIWGLYLGYLPLRSDKEEAKIAHMRLIEMVYQQDSRIFDRQEFITEIVRIFGSIVNTDLLLPSANQQVIDMLRSMQQTLSSDVMSAIWKSLSREEQERIQHIFLT